MRTGYFDSIPREIDFPKVSKALESHIGKFMVAWGTLERELDMLFPVLFRVDPTLVGCIYANLGTQAKLDILASAIHTLRRAIGNREATSAQKLLEKIRKLNTEARNTLAHGQVLGIQDGKVYETWTIMRQVARKKYSLIFYPVDAKTWKRTTQAVNAAAAAMRRRTVSIHVSLKNYSDYEIEGLVEVQARDGVPIPHRPRKRRPPKTSGSKGHQPTRGKRP